MKTSRLALIFTFALLACAFAAQAEAYTGYRFGPFLYYAPYYFPPNGSCMGQCFTPDDFKPQYEDPNPLPPPMGRFPAPRPHPQKVKITKSQPCGPPPTPLYAHPQGPPPGPAPVPFRGRR